MDFDGPGMRWCGKEEEGREGWGEGRKGEKGGRWWWRREGQRMHSIRLEGRGVRWSGVEKSGKGLVTEKAVAGAGASAMVESEASLGMDMPDEWMRMAVSCAPIEHTCRKKHV